MNFVFLIGSVQAFFLSLLAFSKKPKVTPDYILSSWLFFMGLHLLAAYTLIDTVFFDTHPYLERIIQPFPTLQGPFMLVYTLLLTSRKPRIKPIYFVHTIPYLFFSLYLIIELSLNAEGSTLSDFTRTVYVLRVICNSFLGPFYAATAIILLYKHSKRIKNQFSHTEKIDLNWLKYILGVTVAIWTIVISLFILRTFWPTLQISNPDKIIYLTLTVIVFFLGYNGIKQQIIYQPEPTGVNDPKSPKEETHQYEKSGLQGESQKHLEPLLRLMKDEKPYLENKLTLPQLAHRLDLSTNILSMVINKNLNQSFFDFVNGHRVKEMQQCMREPKYDRFTLLATALDCGFNSKSSFNRIFKEHTGTTPSQYQKTLLL